jgi:site-specific DNA-methyltransferase (adenine-specific)
VKPHLIKGDCFEYRHDHTDVVVVDPPFEQYCPAWIEQLESVLPPAFHFIVFSKFPYTGMVQENFQRLPLVAEYIWHYTDMCTYRAKHMPLIHHETISIFSADTSRIFLDRIRRPHEITKPSKFTTRKSRGKEGKPLHWEQDERGGWPSSVISVQRSLKGDMLNSPVPTGAKPVELFEKLLPAFPGHIFDPFMGSGSVGVYAGKNKIPYTGYEINDVYFETARDRIDAAFAQQDLFDAAS